MTMTDGTSRRRRRGDQGDLGLTRIEGVLQSDCLEHIRAGRRSIRPTHCGWCMGRCSWQAVVRREAPLGYEGTQLAFRFQPDITADHVTKEPPGQAA